MELQLTFIPVFTMDIKLVLHPWVWQISIESLNKDTEYIVPNFD